MQMQSTYWLDKVLKMITLYVNALLCTLQHTVIHTMQLSGVNSLNFSSNIFLQVFHEKPACLTTYYERVYKQMLRQPNSLCRDGVWLAIPQSQQCQFSEFQSEYFPSRLPQKTGPSLSAYYRRVYKQMPQRPISLCRDCVWLAIPQSASIPKS
jgi:hypothetical protein